MSNSHCRVLIGRDADCFRMYLMPFLQGSFPGIQIQRPGQVSDHVNCVIDAYHRSDAPNVQKYKNVPNLKIILITGEPGGINNAKAGFVHLIIDCKRDPNLRPSGVAFIYLPFYVASFAERLAHPRDLLLPLNFSPQSILNQKSRFCAYMYSQPVNFRDQLFDCFARNYKSPDALGACRNPQGKSRGDTDRVTYNLAHQTYYELAVEKYKPYKFVIACENSRINGYVTEKITNPILARSVPIYLGAPDLFSDGVFNRKAIIHVGDFPSYEACVEHVKKVDQDDELYMSYLREPLFVNNKLPDYFRSDYLLGSFLKVFGQ